MRKPVQPQLVKNPVLKPTFDKTTVHPLNKEAIDEKIFQENTLHKRTVLFAFFAAVLSVGLYFLMKPELWQTVLSTMIITSVLLFSCMISIFQIRYNKQIRENLANQPYIVVSEASIKINKVEIHSHSIDSIIHAKLNNISSMEENSLIKKGEQILIFTQDKDENFEPYPIDKIDTLYTRVYSLPLNYLESPENLLESIAKFSEYNNISYTANESSVRRISNETVNIHKSLENDEQDANLSSIELYDFNN